MVGDIVGLMKEGGDEAVGLYVIVGVSVQAVGLSVNVGLDVVVGVDEGTGA
jgi:hypothetical protein